MVLLDEAAVVTDSVRCAARFSQVSCTALFLWNPIGECVAACSRSESTLRLIYPCCPSGRVILLCGLVVLLNGVNTAAFCYDV